MSFLSRLPTSTLVRNSDQELNHALAIGDTEEIGLIYSRVAKRAKRNQFLLEAYDRTPLWRIALHRLSLAWNGLSEGAR